ncbi:MAG: histidine kinase [Clostridiales bacterium]|nr:histidine kinase [Clostridiales bacterium]
MKHFQHHTLFKSKMSNISLRSRIMMIYFGMVLILIPLLGFMANMVIFKSLRSDYSISVLESAKQVAKDVEFRKQMYENALLQISFDEELSDRLVQHNDSYQQCWETVNYIYKSFGFIKDYLPGVEDFRIYHTNESFTEDDVIIWRPDSRLVSGIESEKWFETVLNNPNTTLWHLFYDTNKGQYMMSLSCRLNSLRSPVKGCLYLAVRDNETFNSLVENSFSEQGEYFLAANDGTIFGATNMNTVGKNIRNTDYSNLKLDKNYVEIVRIDGAERFVAVQQISNNWYVIVSFSALKFENKLANARMWLFCIMAFIVILSGGMLLIILNNMFGRLDQISEHMSSIMKGEFDVAVKKGGPDEISIIEERFNHMAARLNTLMHEVVTAKIKEREQALKVLESEINPHFLYNTLGLIRWEALDTDNKKLCNIVDSMTTFYRLALNKGNSILKVRDELEHVKSYISIQQLRYQDIVDVYWDIDESALDFYTIKLLLQPIVENCYKHGMIINPGNRKIWISIKYTDEKIVFQVKDNGAGMTHERLNTILEDNGANGVGLRYIHEMLNVYFKDKATLKVESVQGKGTCVTVVIPACSQEPKIKE